MTADGATGFAIAPDGDIEAVFANKAAGAPKGVTKSTIPQAIANGGTKLDCYGPELVRIYARYGFIPVARVEFNAAYANPGWDSSKKTPDIYFMLLGGDSADTVVQNYGRYKAWTKAELDALPVMDYDAAYAYRDGLQRRMAALDRMDEGTRLLALMADPELQAAVEEAHKNTASGEAEGTGINTDTAILAGQVTTIQNPYYGEVPTYTVPDVKAIPSIDAESVQTAEKQIQQARADEMNTGRNFRSSLARFYENVFRQNGGARGILVSGVQIDGKPYIVILNQNAVSKVISDKNMSAHKLAVFDNLDAIVENGEYVGSGKYIQKGKKQKDTIRFDYFETLVKIAGENYIVAFDVEVFPAANNYRTHKIINEIDLIPTRHTDTGTRLPQGRVEQSLSLKPSIP